MDAAMLETRKYERVENDAYWTPEWCVDALNFHADFRGGIWEPACGSGNIVTVLRDDGYGVTATDIADYGCPRSVADFDFLDQRRIPNGCRAIVTNPPYLLAEEFIRHALSLTELVEGQVAMLLRNEFDSAGTRRDLFGQPPFAMKLTLTRRPKWDTAANKAEKGSPRHNFSWFVWDWRHAGPAIIRYGP